MKYLLALLLLAGVLRGQDAASLLPYVTASTGRANVLDGLVGWWPVDDATGTTLRDAVSTNTAACQGDAHWMNDGHPYLHLDGTGDYARVASSFPAVDENNMTLCFWVKQDYYGGYSRSISREYVFEYSRWPMWWAQIQTDGVVATGNLLDGESTVSQLSVTAVPTGTWCHVVAVHSTDGDQNKYMAIYLNGVSDVDSMVGYSAEQKTEFGDVLLGGMRFNNVVYTAHGGYRDFRIYNRAVTSNEVSVIYEYGRL